jgi:ribosome recycling factor
VKQNQHLIKGALQIHSHSVNIIRVGHKSQNMLQQIVCDMYDSGEFLTAKKLVMKMKEPFGLSCSKRSKLRI